MALSSDDDADLTSLAGSGSARPTDGTTESDLAALASAKQHGSAQSPSSWMQWPGVVGRGLAEGITGLVTGPYALGVWGGNELNNHVLPHLGIQAPSNELNPSAASNLVDRGLTRLGVPQAQNVGQSLVQAGAGFAGGFMFPAGALARATGAAEEGVALGMRETPGEAANSTALRMLEAKAESSPWTAGPAASLKANNQTVLNRAWANSIGENADHLTPDVLDNASRRLSGVFEQAGDSNLRKIDPAMLDSQLSTLNADLRGLPGNPKIDDNPLVQDLMNWASGPQGGATGKQLSRLSSQLGKAALRNMQSPNGDRDVGIALYKVKDGVDDLLTQGMPADQAKEFEQARSQYRSLMQLTHGSNNVNVDTGNVNGTTIGNYLQRTDRNGYTFGRNSSPAYQATRFVRGHPGIVGNSGTATRSVGFGDLWQAPFGIPLNMASRLYYGNPAGVARGALGAEEAYAGEPLPAQ